MDIAKRKRLEKKGWKIGTAAEFLNMTPEEAAYVELKLRLSRTLMERRRRLGMSQVAVAKKIRSSQSRVAKMEKGDPSVSIDLIVRSLLALGEPARALEKTF